MPADTTPGIRAEVVADNPGQQQKRKGVRVLEKLGEFVRRWGYQIAP
jgi:hypothetical protein